MSCKNCEENPVETYVRIGDGNVMIVGCVKHLREHMDNFSDSIVLLFEELPDSHPEGVISHQINRLLEASREEKE